MQGEEDTEADPPPFDPAVLDVLLGGTTAGVGVLDTELRFLYVNPALERLDGLPAREHLGRPIGEVLPEVDAREDVLRAVLRDGRPREAVSSGQTWAPSALERRYWHGAYHRLEENGRIRGVVVLVLEISKAQHQQEQLERARRHLALLDTAAVSIGTTLDMDTTCRELAEFVVPALADVAAVEVCPSDIGHTVRHAPPGVLRLRRSALVAVPELQAAADQFGRPGEYIDYQEDAPVPRCLEANLPRIEDLAGEEQLTRSELTRKRVEAARAVGMHAAVIVPLTVRGRPLGCLSLARAEGSPPFTDEDVLVARELAGRAAVDLDHARHYAHEHTIARELQNSLLAEPRGPQPHVEVVTRYLPADQGALVGGDWFDVIPLRGGRHLKAMGDVMGHGVEAAVAMSHYRSLLRLLAEDDQPPHLILDRLDRAVERSGVDRAATCLLAVVDRSRGVCHISSAGHLPPVFIDPGASAARIAELPVGPPLGMGFGAYTTTTVPCGPGTVLLMYTDGLVERRNEDIDVSVGRLASVTLPSSGRLDDLLEEVIGRFGRDAEDDIAVLASRIRDAEKI
ncbi:SpoIIE family protein phosphatase [Streptomyces griseus]|uniref:SpoIIE family protein phosphatase n=1 Tax=Streptomyces griseus TaxID=1911 RepID=UPI0008407D7C|nr:SpoIIE family protein phosphatase [Streptomyces griseus]